MRRLLYSLALLAALAVGPAMADSLDEVRAGNAAFGEGRYEAAVDAFTRAILAGDLEPEALALTFNNRGVAYSELGDYDRAIQDYEQALSLRPGDATATKNLRIGYARRGTANANLGDKTQALADYTKAIELEPDHAPSYLRRGALHLERGDDRAALADLEKAWELDPLSREAEQALARIRSRLAVAADAPAPAADVPPDTAAPPMSPPGPTADAPAPTEPVGTGSMAAVPETPEPARPPPPPVDVVEGPARPHRTTQAVNYRDGPGNDYPRTGTLNGGTVVDVVAEARGWFKIRLRNGKEGFVYQRYLEPVSP
jgi:Flp pilus assembly protein TadD